MSDTFTLTIDTRGTTKELAPREVAASRMADYVKAIESDDIVSAMKFYLPSDASRAADYTGLATCAAFCQAGLTLNESNIALWADELGKQRDKVNAAIPEEVRDGQDRRIRQEMERVKDLTGSAAEPLPASSSS